MVKRGSKEDLNEFINSRCFSENWIITEDDKLYSKRLNKVFENASFVYSEDEESWRIEMR